MDLNRLVWVKVGKTDHQAWLVESAAENQEGSSAEGNEVLIKWDISRYTEWVPWSSVRQGIPSRRRGASQNAGKSDQAPKQNKRAILSSRKSHSKSTGNDSSRRRLQSKKRPRTRRANFVEEYEDDESSSRTRQLSKKMPKVEKPITTKHSSMSRFENETCGVATSSGREKKTVGATKQTGAFLNNTRYDEHNGEEQVGDHRDKVDVTTNSCAPRGSTKDTQTSEERDVEPNGGQRTGSDDLINFGVESRDEDREGSFANTRSIAVKEPENGESWRMPKGTNGEIRKNSVERQQEGKVIERLIVDRTPDNPVKHITLEGPATLTFAKGEVTAGQVSPRDFGEDKDSRHNGDGASESGSSSVPTLNSLGSNNAVDKLLDCCPPEVVQCGIFNPDDGRGLGEESFVNSRSRDLRELVSTLQHYGPDRNLRLLASVLDFLPQDI